MIYYLSTISEFFKMQFYRLAMELTHEDKTNDCFRLMKKTSFNQNEKKKKKRKREKQKQRQPKKNYGNKFFMKNYLLFMLFFLFFFRTVDVVFVVMLLLVLLFICIFVELITGYKLSYFFFCKKYKKKLLLCFFLFVDCSCTSFYFFGNY